MPYPHSYSAFHSHSAHSMAAHSGGMTWRIYADMETPSPTPAPFADARAGEEKKGLPKGSFPVPIRNFPPWPA